MASLETSDYAISLQAANAKLMEVQDEYNRLKIMYERNSLSESDFLKAKAGLELAKAQKQSSEKSIKDTRLYAPISEVLLKKMVSEGEIIGKGTPFFGLVDIDAVHFNTAIPEGKINQVKLQQEAQVSIPALDSIVTGKIIEVGFGNRRPTRLFLSFEL